MSFDDVYYFDTARDIAPPRQHGPCGVVGNLRRRLLQEEEYGSSVSRARTWAPNGFGGARPIGPFAERLVEHALRSGHSDHSSCLGLGPDCGGRIAAVRYDAGFEPTGHGGRKSILGWATFTRRSR